MADVTVVYYTSNRQRPEFENAIMHRLRTVAADVPIISVSQKPINLGRNICVGDVGASRMNIPRQIYLGLRAAKTEWIATAEADTLVAPGHLEFKPGRLNVYTSGNAWILRAWDPHRYVYRGRMEGLTWNRREWLMERLESVYGSSLHNWEPGRAPNYWDWDESGLIDTGLAVIVCKVAGGLHLVTGHRGIYVPELPYWGRATELSEELNLTLELEEAVA